MNDNMDDFNIGAMKARNIAAQFGVIEKAQNSEISSKEETAEEVIKARNAGDIHPNGKWVWTEYKPGHFDWRPLKGRGGVDRTPKGSDASAKKEEDESGKKKLLERKDALDVEIKKLKNQIIVNGDSVRKVLQDKKKKLESEREDIVERISKISSDSQASSSEDKKKIFGVSRIMEGFKIQKNSYSDLSKMSLEKTPKGNWRLYYDGKDTGTTMQSSVISEENAKKAGLWSGDDDEDVDSEENKGQPTVDDYAKKAPTKNLENAISNEGAPGSIRGAAEAELKARKNAEIAKKLNLHSKGKIAETLTKIAQEWDSYDENKKTQTKRIIEQNRNRIADAIKNGEVGDDSFETIKVFSDLVSLGNYIKQKESQPKQIGEVIESLLSDLKKNQ